MSATQTRPERRLDLDWLRVLATANVFLFHAARLFRRAPMAGHPVLFRDEKKARAEAGPRAGRRRLNDPAGCSSMDG